MKIQIFRKVYPAAAALICAALLTGCGQRINTAVETEPQTTKQTVKITEKVPTEPETEAVTESETAAPKLITSVDYTSKDGSVKITLPDNTWKVTQDADEMRVFQSGSAAIINIVHANTPTAMKNLSVMTSRESLDTSLKSQYTTDNAYEIEDFTTANVNNVDVYRYIVKYNDARRMWAYAVTNAIVAQDQAYVVTGTVTDENQALLASVRKAVESFRVLNDDTLKNVTGEIITGTAQKTSETVNTATMSGQEAKSLKAYGTTATLVTVDTVNMRSQPGTDASILTTLTGNTKVTVTGETQNWFQVQINGNTGYIRKDFLVYPNQAQTQSQETSADTSSQSSAELGTATNYGSTTTLYASSDVNIRSAPGTDSAVAGSLASGMAVSVIGETDNWFIVSVGGSTGYVSKAYLTYDSSVSNGTTANAENTGGGGGQSQETTDPSSISSVSGTVTSTTVDTITVAGDDGKTYTIYYGGASVNTQDGLYSGVYISASLDGSQAAGDGTLYANSISGY